MLLAKSSQLGPGLPHDPAAERAILGVILLDMGKSYPEALAQLPTAPQRHAADSLFLPSHQVIFRAMGACLERHADLDPLTLCATLEAQGELERVGGPAFISGLTDGLPRYSKLDNYFNAVRTCALRRELVFDAERVKAAALDLSEPIESVLESAQRIGYDLEIQGAADDWQTLGALAEKQFNAIVQASESDSFFIGTATGFTDLDYLTCGFEKGELIYLAARPSMGKSGLAFGIARQAAVHSANVTADGKQKAVACFSLEMSREMVTNRWLAENARIDLRRLRQGMLQKDEWQRLTQTTEDFRPVQSLLIDDRPNLTPMQLRAKLRRIRQPLSLILVDYLSLLQIPEGAKSSSKDNEKLRGEALSRDLKTIAKEFQAPVLVILPLNKTEGGKPPTLADVAYVGGYEPDIVMALHREDYYNPESARQNIADLMILKNRNGPTGKIELTFIKQTASFTNVYRG